MPKALEIKLTARGFQITMGGRTADCTAMADAIDFAHRRLGTWRPERHSHQVLGVGAVTSVAGLP